MKKIFYILASAIVALGAVACDNQDLDTLNPADGLTISATIDNTKVTFDADLNASWHLDDKITIGEYTFVQEEGKLGIFKCNTTGVESLIGQEVCAICGTIDSTAGLAGSQFNAVGTIKATGTELAFAPVNALLSVKAEADNAVLKSDMFTAGVELTKGTETYIPMLAGEGVTIEYWVGNEKFNTLSNKTFKAGELYKLGTLYGGYSEYGVVGSFQTPTTWDVAAPVKMINIADGWVVAKGVELYKSDEFKLIKGNSWDVSYGFKNVDVLMENSEVKLDGDQNIKACKNGKFDIYFNGSTQMAKYVCVEEYANLTVNITIDNKANWSPLYITLKDGDAVVANNATVSNNNYQVSGEYIGKTLTCTLSNGTKTSDVMNVTITKNGATITLEETIIKLKVQLNTNNAKQWWGNTMKIHVWDTKTSFDTSWPGNTMTSEGNYTWSIIVPSELVGKTIKYCVHNGNGWQSKDATVTIDAKGNTVTGSSIGIN